MRKAILLIVILALVPGMLFAARLSNKSVKNISTTVAVLKNINDPDLAKAYEKQAKQRIGTPLLCNTLIGFGAGSLVQGDRVGALLGFGGEAISTGIAITGYIGMRNGTIEEEKAKPIMIAGASLLGAMRIYEIVRTFLYQKEYNTQYKAARAKVQLEPTSGGITLSARISF